MATISATFQLQAWPSMTLTVTGCHGQHAPDSSVGSTICQCFFLMGSGAWNPRSAHLIPRSLDQDKLFLYSCQPLTAIKILAQDTRREVRAAGQSLVLQVSAMVKSEGVGKVRIMGVPSPRKARSTR